MRRRGTIWKPAALAAALGALAALSAGVQAYAQEAPPDRSQYAGMAHIAGEVSAVSGSTLTVKTENNQTLQVVTTTNTRIVKDRANAVKVADLKTGDGIVAIGNLDAPTGTMHAAMVFATDAATLKAMKENLGKTYIAGKVTAIDMDKATLTIERPDHVSQTIGLDETTSFKRGVRGAPGGQAGLGSGGVGTGPGESVTLADIKVGDMVRGTGALKGGVFIPAQLTIMVPGAGQGGRHRGAGAGGTAAIPPA